MIDKARLATKCSTWNIELTGTQLDLLDKYAELLVSYNEKVNLTAITSPEGIEDRHFADSLLFAAQPEVQGKLVDVGTGAGFPGIVAKIYKPDLQLTLMEPTGKRVDFLKYACAELGLTGVEFAKERAEEAARKIWREQFDVRILPAACQGRRQFHRHERPRGRRRGEGRGQCPEKAGRSIRGNAPVHPAGRQRTRAGILQKNIADSDRLPPKRRKNRKKTVVTAQKTE